MFLSMSISDQFGNGAAENVEAAICKTSPRRNSHQPLGAVGADMDKTDHKLTFGI